jgi:hypothetical protein
VKSVTCKDVTCFLINRQGLIDIYGYHFLYRADTVIADIGLKSVKSRRLKYKSQLIWCFGRIPNNKHMNTILNFFTLIYDRKTDKNYCYVIDNLFIFITHLSSTPAHSQIVSQ